MRLVLSLVFSFVITLISTSSFAAERPNFIIIYVDDLGWADTSVPMMDSDPDSASDFHQTPNLEKLAKGGNEVFLCLRASAYLHALSQEHSVRKDACTTPVHFRARCSGLGERAQMAGRSVTC